jgi:hypothetical protein
MQLVASQFHLPIRCLLGTFIWRSASPSPYMDWMPSRTCLFSQQNFCKSDRTLYNIVSIVATGIRGAFPSDNNGVLRSVPAALVHGFDAIDSLFVLLRLAITGPLHLFPFEKTIRAHHYLMQSRQQIFFLYPSRGGAFAYGQHKNS